MFKIFYKKIAVYVFLLAAFSVSASAQTLVSTDGEFRNAYYAGGQQNLLITQDINHSANLSWGGANLDLFADLQNHTMTFQNFVNSGAPGGAIRFISGKAVFSNGAIDFLVNTSSQTGGAIIVANPGVSFGFSNSTVNFTGNNAASDGGAIAVASGILNIENSKVFFTGNTGNAHGGAIAGNAALVNISGSTVTFDSNMCGGNGGALYAVYSSVMNITDSSVSFSSNSTPQVGGAVFIYGNSNVTFTNSNVSFTGNSGGWFGGAVEIEENSTLNFIDSTVNFEGNQSPQGGAIALKKFGSGIATVNFENSNVYFTGNTGSAAIRNEGNLIFNPGAGNEVVFSNNIGGDIYQTADGATAFKGSGRVVIGSGISGSGSITKEGDGTLYINGNSGGYGGVYTQSNGTVEINAGFFNGTNNINGGTARINDGGTINSALLMSAGSLLNINVTGNFNLQHAKFSGTGYDILKTNTGTLNITEDFGTHTGTFTQEDGNTIVTNNTFNSQHVINGGILTFNDGAGVSQDTKVYLGEDAEFNVNTSGNLNFAAKFLSGSGALNKTGSGTLNITGDNSGYDGVYTQDGGSTVISSNTFSGEHNVNNGEMEWATGTVLSNGATFYIGSGSVLNITSAQDITISGSQVTSAADGVINKTDSGRLILDGNVEIAGALNADGGELAFNSGAKYSGSNMKINGAALNMRNDSANAIVLTGDFESVTELKMDVFSDGTNDKITAVAANIDGNIDIFAGVGKYDKNEYYLIITGGTNSLTGVFASSSIFSADNSDLDYEIKYEDGIVKLIVSGVHTTSFGDLSPLTYNQTQTSEAFGKISENPGAWAPILNEMVIRQNNGTEADIAAVKDFLARTSGYFLANAIRNMAADSPNNEVYDKIRNHAEEHKTNSGLWVQVRGGLESFKKDENSLEDYNDLSLGVMFGFDRFLADKLWNGDVMWGVYGRINKDNAEQGNSKADGNKNGLGLYGGYIKDTWELKAMLLGSYDRFSTERAVMGETAKADISGVTVSGDIEAAIKIWMNDNINFRPYAGVEAANTMYGGFKESGAGIYNLDTQSGNYLRTAGRVGAGLDYEKGIWIWYANLEGKYIFDGTKPEITSRFVDTGIDFYSRGAKEGHLQIGAGLGGEVRITENWKGFANAKYYTAERYENLYGNMGVRYVFGKNKSKANNTAEARRKAETAGFAEEAKVRAAAVEAQRKAEEARLQAEAARSEQAKLEQERIKAEEERRIAEEAKITMEISDEDLAKQKIEAEERRKRPMLKTYTLKTHFRTNSYFLTDEFKEQIKKIAQELKNYDYKRITIEGHTDSTGTKEWNKKLSRQRAKSVYDEFAKAGVDGNKMTYEGFADTMPLESNKIAKGRAANRRTEIFVE